MSSASPRFCSIIKKVFRFQPGTTHYQVDSFRCTLCIWRSVAIFLFIVLFQTAVSHLPDFFKSCCIWKIITNLKSIQRSWSWTEWKSSFSRFTGIIKTMGRFCWFFGTSSRWNTTSWQSSRIVMEFSIGTGSGGDIFLQKKNHFCNVHIWMNQLLPF